MNRKEARILALDFAWRVLDTSIGSGKAYDDDATDEDNEKFIKELNEIIDSLYRRWARLSKNAAKKEGKA